MVFRFLKQLPETSVHETDLTSPSPLYSMTCAWGSNQVLNPCVHTTVNIIRRPLKISARAPSSASLTHNQQKRCAKEIIGANASLNLVPVRSLTFCRRITSLLILPTCIFRTFLYFSTFSLSRWSWTSRRAITPAISPAALATTSNSVDD